jgi:hypothetical protein
MARIVRKNEMADSNRFVQYGDVEPLEKGTIKSQEQGITLKSAANEKTQSNKKAPKTARLTNELAAGLKMASMFTDCTITEVISRSFEYYLEHTSDLNEAEVNAIKNIMN